MPNHLATESSPYLLQHQNNPVDWYPWGPEALARAKAENRPIFLSIGYSACHWCHVMEHESFEDEGIAALLNEQFISIKVDREERPDLDQIYMNAVQLMTGRGGWPMSVFLTPDLQPFFGGTYWPPTSKMGMPGFDQVLRAVIDAWQNRREAAVEQARQLTEAIQESGDRSQESGDVGGRRSEIGEEEARQILANAQRQLARAFDSVNGGFGSAPKFPHSMDLQLLLRLWKRRPSEELLHMVTHTLEKMKAGGINDHLAGGFARYSVDERWLVPHFEKMLYDNALLTSAYLDALQATWNMNLCASTARRTCEYILRYMTDPAGGFHSTEDADSEGEEGKFYVWTPAEIKEVLGDEQGERFCYVYDVTEQGNFEHGKSILNLPKMIWQCAKLRGWNEFELMAELKESREKLLAVRDRRVRPGKDDKILTSWNALMIDALARAAGLIDGKAPTLHDAAERFRSAAIAAANFILRELRRPDGRLLHTWRHGKAKLDAYLDDYAYLVNALVTLYEATFDERWIDEAVRLADVMRQRFEDKQGGGFFYTTDNHEQLIARNKDFHDASVPSGNGMAATALIRLGKLTGRSEYVESARGAIVAGLPIMERAPTAAGQLLIALDMWLGPIQELVLVGGSDQAINRELVASLRRRYLPNAVVAYRPGGGASGGSSPSLACGSTPLSPPGAAFRRPISRERPAGIVCVPELHLPGAGCRTRSDSGRDRAAQRAGKVIASGLVRHATCPRWFRLSGAAMANDRTTRELLDAEHLAENRREFWTERGAWVGMLLLVLAAALGGLGPGPLSQREATSADGTLRVQYAAMERYQAPSELHITWIGQSPPAGPVDVAISRPLVDRAELTQLTPPPARVETRAGAVVLTYDAAALADGRPIVYRYQHEHFGPIAFDVSLVGAQGGQGVRQGGQGVRVTQFVWP